MTRCRVAGSWWKATGAAGAGTGAGARVGNAAVLPVGTAGVVAAGSCAHTTFPAVRPRYQAHRRLTASTNTSPRPLSWSGCATARTGGTVLASHISTVNTASQTVSRSATPSSGRLAFTALEANSHVTSSARSTVSASTDQAVSVRTVLARASGTAAAIDGKCATATRITGDSSALTPSP